MPLHPIRVDASDLASPPNKDVLFACQRLLPRCRAFGMELPATLMYDYPTLGQYCDHLTDVLDSQELRKSSKGNVTADRAPRTMPSSLSATPTSGEDAVAAPSLGALKLTTGGYYTVSL